MAGFVKLYGTIMTSSVWVESHETFRVWMTMLVLADRNGYVAGTPPGLASIARVTLDECEEALKVLISPDKHSRTKEHRGCRIEAADGGWNILNHAKYRELRSEKQIATAERVQKHRAKEKGVTASVTSVTGNDVTHQRTEDIVQSSSSSSARERLLHTIPSWKGLLAMAEDGANGAQHKVTPAQLEMACADYLAGNHHLNNPSPIHFRAFLRRAVKGEKMDAPTTTDELTELHRYAAQRDAEIAAEKKA